jgi:3-phosphoshikimate 1-carboxyvinyltransferase
MLARWQRAEIGYAAGWRLATRWRRSAQCGHSASTFTEGNILTFHGRKFSAPQHPIDCANAGTLMRLLTGLLTWQHFPSVLDGSEQLRRRPMRRIVEPLRLMGAQIADTEGRAPLTIHPAPISGINYQLPLASAQVKSAILLAGLGAAGSTTVTEPGPGRDHTERMLAAMGVPVEVQGNSVTLQPLSGSFLMPLDITVPGDISSAAFLMVAASIVLHADVQITGVGLNPTRTGILDVLRRMGAEISLEDEALEGGEPVGTLTIGNSELHSTHIGGDEVVRAIDELPILAVAATQANGETLITDASELRVKEVDRIGMLARELRKMGARIEERPDGMLIQGPVRLRSAQVTSHGDHRLGMALAVAGLVAEGETRIADAGCIDDSFPGFTETLVRLGASIG